MKYIILLTWFFLYGCSKAVEPALDPSIDVGPVSTVIVEKDIWVIKVQVKAPSNQTRYVEVETVHASAIWHTIVFLEPGQTKHTAPLSTTEEVVAWKIIRSTL